MYIVSRNPNRRIVNPPQVDTAALLAFLKAQPSVTLTHEAVQTWEAEREEAARKAAAVAKEGDK